MSAQLPTNDVTLLERYRINADAIQSLDDVRELFRLMNLHVRMPAERLEPVRHLLVPADQERP